MHPFGRVHRLSNISVPYVNHDFAFFRTRYTHSNISLPAICVLCSLLSARALLLSRSITYYYIPSIPRNDMASERYRVGETPLVFQHELTSDSVQQQHQKRHKDAQYIHVPRHSSHSSSSTKDNYAGFSPMDRWENESPRDQPWHALSTVEKLPSSSTKKTKSKRGSSHKAAAGSKA